MDNEEDAQPDAGAWGPGAWFTNEVTGETIELQGFPAGLRQDSGEALTLTWDASGNARFDLG